MANILTNSATAVASDTPSSSITSTDRFDTFSTSTENQNFGNSQELTCPAHCACACPQVSINSNNRNGVKKVDLDVTLLPCARTAAYQLDLAIKLCKRK